MIDYYLCIFALDLVLRDFTNFPVVMYYRSSATVTRDGVVPIDQSVTGKIDSVMDTNKILADKTTRLSRKPQRSRLDEHLSDLKSKERSFFPSSFPAFTSAETPISSPDQQSEYQIHPNFINQQIKSTERTVDTTNRELSSSQSIIKQPVSSLNNTKFQLVGPSEDIIFPDTTEFSDLSLPPLSPPQHTSPPFHLFNTSACEDSDNYTFSPTCESFCCETNNLLFYSKET